MLGSFMDYYIPHWFWTNSLIVPYVLVSVSWNLCSQHHWFSEISYCRWAPYHVVLHLIWQCFGAICSIFTIVCFNPFSWLNFDNLDNLVFCLNFFLWFFIFYFNTIILILVHQYYTVCYLEIFIFFLVFFLVFVEKVVEIFLRNSL